MELKKLEKTPENIDRVAQISEEAFPENERIPAKEMFGGLKGMEQTVLGIFEGPEMAGFISMLRYENCAYIGYFAIAAEYRSHGLGAETLHRLDGFFPDCQIIVDFEAPDAAAENNPQRVRRREFYLRNGFFETGDYQFYMETEFEITCSRQDYDRAAFERLKEKIRESVPDFHPVIYRK